MQLENHETHEKHENSEKGAGQLNGSHTFREHPNAVRVGANLPFRVFRVFRGSLRLNSTEHPAFGVSRRSRGQKLPLTPNLITVV